MTHLPTPIKKKTSVNHLQSFNYILEHYNALTVETIETFFLTENPFQKILDLKI